MKNEDQIVESAQGEGAENARIDQENAQQSEQIKKEEEDN